jgi:transcriptional regulator with XRE-family HTH domain
MRSKKKVSRDQMATKMRMTSSRLKEIEDGDDADDEELDEIAKGLGISKQKLKRTLDSLSGKEEEHSSNGKIKIIRRVIEIKRPTIFTQEEIVDFEVKEGKWDEAYRINGFISEETIKKNPDGTLNFSVQLFKYGELTSNNNRYTEEFANNLIKHFKRLDKKTSKISYEDIPGLTANDIAVAEMLEGHSLDMMATHRARQGKGNPILERAGRILGGREGKIESDKTFILLAKTIGGPAGESVTAQISEGMIRGVSLYAWPVKFEENSEGGHDVFDGMLVGADFTNEGGNLIQFKDKANAAPVLN